MSEAALEEVSVLSSIYCGEGELTVRQQDGWAHGADQQQRWRERRLDSLQTQCQDIRQKLLGQAAALPPEPMVHRLEFCRLLKTVKVDLDSSGRKCKERMMKGFVVKSYESLPELSAAFQELNMTEIYQQILPSLSG
ncbi:hypothetical protein F7725_027037 [Dissostichus mawsoni]|uniref:Uncharacterized protein n=1 Tax=Dissostichus mawsoni TaxID=36200 RepID=A0A7J5X8S9_DISMA|nr:hypothetical protein F7725_027037 [Dissostichus mawsoni]